MKLSWLFQFTRVSRMLDATCHVVILQDLKDVVEFWPFHIEMSQFNTVLLWWWGVEDPVFTKVQSAHSSLAIFARSSLAICAPLRTCAAFAAAADR
jgi:hypothetical protein